MHENYQHTPACIEYFIEKLESAYAEAREYGHDGCIIMSSTAWSLLAGNFDCEKDCASGFYKGIRVFVVDYSSVEDFYYEVDYFCEPAMLGSMLRNDACIVYCVGGRLPRYIINNGEIYVGIGREYTKTNMRIS